MNDWVVLNSLKKSSSELAILEAKFCNSAMFKSYPWLFHQIRFNVIVLFHECYIGEFFFYRVLWKELQDVFSKCMVDLANDADTHFFIFFRGVINDALE